MAGNEMTFDQFRVLIKAMKAAYPQTTFIPDSYAANLWYVNLKDISYEVLSQAIQTHMQSNEFPPTIAGLRKAAMKYVPHADEEYYRSEEWAWGIVEKATRNALYHAEEMFDRFPALIQEAVGGPEVIRSMAQLPPDTLGSVGKGQFLASYRGVLKRHSEDRVLNQKLQAEIKAVEEYALAKIEAGKPKQVIVAKDVPKYYEEEKGNMIGKTISFVALPEKREEDSAAAASIRAAMQRRIQQEKEEDARREKEAQDKAKADAERIKLSSDEAYEQFVEYAKGKLDSLPSKEELIGFYGLKATADFEQVLALVKCFHKA